MSGGAGLWSIFGLCFLMIFREGVETVSMLAALRLDTSDLWRCWARLLGIGLAILFGVSSFAGTIRVNLKQFFRVTTMI